MITNIKAGIPVEKYLDDNITKIGYGLVKKQLEELDTNDPQCIIKHIHTSNPHMTSDYYYILVGQNTDVYNPFDVFLQRHQILGQDNYMGGKYWNFKKVSKYCYDLYLKYLRTQNNYYIQEVERQIQINI